MKSKFYFFRLWSVIGHPTLQAAVTEPGNLVNINWNKIFGLGPLENAINYQSKPLYSGAIMLLNVSFSFRANMQIF